MQGSAGTGELVCTGGHDGEQTQSKPGLTLGGCYTKNSNFSGTEDSWLTVR